eukprot:gene11786-2146_t
MSAGPGKPPVPAERRGCALKQYVSGLPEAPPVPGSQTTCRECISYLRDRTVLGLLLTADLLHELTPAELHALHSHIMGVEDGLDDHVTFVPPTMGAFRSTQHLQDRTKCKLCPVEFHSGWFYGVPVPKGRKQCRRCGDQFCPDHCSQYVKAALVPDPVHPTGVHAAATKIWRAGMVQASAWTSAWMAPDGADAQDQEEEQVVKVCDMCYTKLVGTSDEKILDQRLSEIPLSELSAEMVSLGQLDPKQDLKVREQILEYFLCKRLQMLRRLAGQAPGTCIGPVTSKAQFEAHCDRLFIQSNRHSGCLTGHSCWLMPALCAAAADWLDAPWKEWTDATSSQARGMIHQDLRVFFPFEGRSPNRTHKCHITKCSRLCSNKPNWWQALHFISHLDTLDQDPQVQRNPKLRWYVLDYAKFWVFQQHLMDADTLSDEDLLVILPRILFDLRHDTPQGLRPHFPVRCWFLQQRAGRSRKVLRTILQLLPMFADDVALGTLYRELRATLLDVLTKDELQACMRQDLLTDLLQQVTRTCMASSQAASPSELASQSLSDYLSCLGNGYGSEGDGHPVFPCPCPTQPDLTVIGIQPKVKVFSSATKPCLFTLEVQPGVVQHEEGLSAAAVQGPTVQVLCKAGLTPAENFGKDVYAQCFVRLCRLLLQQPWDKNAEKAWAKENKRVPKHELCSSILDYPCAPLASDSGLVQFMPGVKDMQSLEDTFKNETKGQSFVPHLTAEVENVGAWTKNADLSLAAYTVIVYLLGKGDLHGENVLLEMETGRLIHIDYGFLFGHGPTAERVGKFVLGGSMRQSTTVLSLITDMSRFETALELVLLTLRQHWALFSWIMAPLGALGNPPAVSADLLPFFRDVCYTDRPMNDQEVFADWLTERINRTPVRNMRDQGLDQLHLAASSGTA